MFLEKNENGLVYMVSDLLPLRHAFTTRFGGVSTGYLSSLNLIGGHGDSPENIWENFRRVAALMGVGPDDCAVTKQVHGNTVRTITEQDRHVCLSDIPYQADGIVTATEGLPIFCFTADCVPVLLADPENGVIGAVHCGWRSSVADILSKAVEEMCTLGAEPEKIRAAIGPAIGACCFETDRDVPDAVETWLGADAAAPYIRKKSKADEGQGLANREAAAHPGETRMLQTADSQLPQKYLVDLRGANACRLRQLGLRQEHIDISAECTYCSHEKYWSHRWAKTERGGQAACIVLPEKKP